MDPVEYCPDKVVDAAEAMDQVKNGSRIFIGTGCGEPQHLVHAMVQNPKIQDAMVCQMLSHTLSKYVNMDFGA
jgi:acyl-CoA hydrolase